MATKEKAPAIVEDKIKGPEHTKVRLPTVEKLKALGWQDSQLQWQPEWRVPKTPHDASKREAGQSFKSWPADLVIFDSDEHAGEWDHVLALLEFKEPTLEQGRNQLEIYLSLEPRARYGYWTNGSKSLAVYKLADGTHQVVEGAPLPRPQDNLAKPSAEPLTFDRLRVPTEKQLKQVFERLLDVIAANDSRSTRREEQLNQICNLLMVKLNSDLKGSEDEEEPVDFQLAESEVETAKRIRAQFKTFRTVRTDVFAETGDLELELDDHTIQQAVYELSSLRLLDMGADAISTAFQVFRGSNVKAGEGQYFTPRRVVESAVAIMEITREDKIIDPACGTGGFLIEAFRSVLVKSENGKALANSRTWAHKQIFGVDKDAINVKLSRAIMVILGDGSANIHVGDSLRKHRWHEDYPTLLAPLKDGQYTVVITNPPFGEKLKISAVDCKRSGFTISNAAAGGGQNKYAALEIGLVFLERAYDLLVAGGRLGIVLPETYFFSSTYAWLPKWLESRLVLRGVLNIPMEAFQGYCRAKTNFYIFEKKAPEAASA
jgi:type I restriction-modification system DNA methylase subunit